MIAIISWNEKEEITTPTPIESSRETTTEAAAISSEVKDSINQNSSTAGVNSTTKNEAKKTTVNVSTSEAKIEVKK